MKMQEYQDYRKREAEQEAAAEKYRSEQDHKQARNAIFKTKTILRNKIGLPEIDKLRTLTADINGGIEHEKKYQGGAGEVIDFVIANLPKMQTIAREFSSHNAGKHFGAVCALLFSHLPAGCSTEPSLPIIKGTDSFNTAVKTVISKLPYSLKRKLSDCAFYELKPGKVAGLCGFPNSQVIAIHSEHSEKELRRTIAHEAAHIFFEDHKTIGGPAMEERAERQAIAWGF